MEKSVTEVTNAAIRALGAVHMKYLYAGGMSHDDKDDRECCRACAVLLLRHMGYS